MANIGMLKKICAHARIDLIKMLGHSGSGHPGGSLSIMETLTALYFHFMRYDASDPYWSDRDRFILSKGHCAPALYVMLGYAGYFDKSEFEGLRKFGRILQGHTDTNMTPGTENCGGPLGQGFSVALGHAIAGKMDGKEYYTYAMVGDGESEKGSINETARLAGVLELNNLICFIDHNKVDQDGYVTHARLPNYEQEWSSYGWHTIAVDGTSIEAIVDAISKAHQSDKPTVIILESWKGSGVSFMEDCAKEGDSRWHGAAPKGDDLKGALHELQTKFDEVAKEVTDDAFEYIDSHKLTDEKKKALTKKLDVSKNEVSLPEKLDVGEEKATRDAFGNFIHALGKADSHVVAVSAGVSGSVKLGKFMNEFGTFSKENHNGRFVQVGIAEANMVGVACGLAQSNKKPWVATFDIFLTECLSVVRNSVCYANLDVKFIGTHAGAGVEWDGGSHQSLITPEIMASMPNMACNEPVDYNESLDLMKLSYESNKAAYFRLTRQAMPILNREYTVDYSFGAYPIRLSEDDDVVICATAHMVGLAQKAASELHKEGINVRIINVAMMDRIVKPQFLDLIGDNRGVVTVHDALYKILGHTVSRALLLPGSTNKSRVISLGLRDFGESGDFESIRKKHKYDVDDIVRACKKVMDAQAKVS